jgi:hypothetical protein
MPNKEGMILKFGLMVANEQAKTNQLLSEIKELLEKKEIKKESVIPLNRDRCYILPLGIEF